MPKNVKKPFKQQKFCQQVIESPLAVSHDEWQALEKRFTDEKRNTVTQGFFLNALSDVRKVPVEVLLSTFLKSRIQPTRSTKRQRDLDEESLPFKKIKRYYQKDEGPNPLIFEKTDENSTLQDKIAAKGVRTTVLNPASPEKGYLNTMRTPGGTKVRPLCDINNQMLFKPFSPMKFKADKAEDPLVTKETLLDALPNATYKKAEPIQFTATLEAITQARGKSRGRSAKAIKGHSASDYFLAHRLEIPNCHFAHLQAHCLGGIQQFDNLIPSTAAANYNTLEAIELHILELLTSKQTDQVHVKVVPTYTNDALIPDLLTYTLNWKDNNSSSYPQEEIIYITPQSASRITKSMHQSIKLLREETKEQESGPSPSNKSI